MKRILNFLDNMTFVEFLCIWFPVLLLVSLGSALLIAYVVNEYNEFVMLLDMITNDKMID
jgi:hypothetical protein